MMFACAYFLMLQKYKKNGIAPKISYKVGAIRIVLFIFAFQTLRNDELFVMIECS
jgi:hypothetical protein